MRQFLQLLVVVVANIAVSSDACAEESSVLSASDQNFFDRGGAALPDKYPAAYNTPAHFDTFVGNSLRGSFIYWAVNQDCMDMATASTEPNNNQTITGVAFQPYFSLQPGFKIAESSEERGEHKWLPSLPDGWVIDLVYTRLHYQIFQSRAAPKGQIWTANSWFITPPSDAIRFTSKWKMHLDVLDEFLNRPLYLGQQLIVNPCLGARLLRLSQEFRANFFNVEDKKAYTINYSRFLSVGMYLGMKSRWLLGKGVYFEGNIATSFLSLAWEKVSHRELSSYVGIANPSGNHCIPLMPCSTMEGGIGFGWGTYFHVKDEKACKKFTGYIDFSARWDWMTIWEQNLMRKWVGQLAGLANATGDLSMNGLTLSGSLYF